MQLSLPFIMEISLERWGQAQWLINTFWTPLKFEDGVPLEIIDSVKRGNNCGLPIAVKEWYALAGRRQDISLSGEGLLGIEWQLPESMRAEDAYPPISMCEPEEDDDIFWFMWADPGFNWGVRLTTTQIDDPPVLVDPDAGRVEFAHESFCAFMTDRLLRSTLLLAQFTGGLRGDEGSQQRLSLKYSLLPAIPESQYTLYGDDETLIIISNSLAEISLQIAAKTKEALNRLCKCVGGDNSLFKHRGFFWSHRMSEDCSTIFPDHIVRPTEEMAGACQWPPCHSPERGMTDFTYVTGGYRGYMTFRGS